MEYRMVYVTVSDSAGKAVVLDSNYTEIVNSKKKIIEPADSLEKTKGIYLLITDSQKDIIAENVETDVNFIGKKGSAVVVVEHYVITQDGCHIRLVSGNTNIVIHHSQ